MEMDILKDKIFMEYNFNYIILDTFLKIWFFLFIFFIWFANSNLFYYYFSVIVQTLSHICLQYK